MHHHGSARKLCLWDRSWQARLQGRPPATKRRRPFCPDQLRLARSAGRIEDAGRTRAAAQAFIEGSRRQRQRLRHRDFRSGITAPDHRAAGHTDRSSAQRASAQRPRGFEPGMHRLRARLRTGPRRGNELVLVRSIEYGGKSLTHGLTADGAVDADAARVMIEDGDAGMAEICRTSLTRLATEVRNSIGFYEGQHEQSIHRIFVSGGLAKTETILQTLSDELGLPCEIWDPLETCEVALPPAKRQALPNEFVSLNVACGAAFEYLRN